MVENFLCPSSSLITGMPSPSASARDAYEWRLFRIRNNRHSYASIAIAHGETVLTIGRLLGHNDPATTLTYTHLADASVREAAEAVIPVLGEEIKP